MERYEIARRHHRQRVALAQHAPGRLRTRVGTGGPITLDFRSTPDDYVTAVTAALESDEIDGLIVIHAPPRQRSVGEPTAEIDAATVGATKPVVAVLLGARDGPIRPGSAVPGFAFPEVAPRCSAGRGRTDIGCKRKP